MIHQQRVGQSASTAIRLMPSGPDAVAGASFPATPTRSTGTARTHILLVEDDSSIRDALTSLLEDEQFAVTAVSNGLEALACLRQSAPPDLIILDLRMPVMDGWRFRTEQKADDLIADIPVLAISADVSPQAAAIDAAAYLRKPLEPETLLAAVNKIVGQLERKRLGKRLEEAERFAALGRLAASVGHEINNPLTCVSMNLEAVTSTLGRFLHTRQTDSEAHASLGELPELFDECRICVDRIRDVVRDLQKLTRSPEVRRGKFSLNEVVDESLVMARHQVEHRARIQKRYGELPAVLGVRSAIGQVLLNLILNAAQSIPEGRADSNEIRLSTWLDPTGAAVVVEVADTGEGIPAGAMPHLFDPFFTTKPVGEGTGLGLSVSYRIVADHGGRIEVDSQPGLGSTFRVILPVTEPSGPVRVPPPALPSGSVDAREAKTSPPARILVIDDLGAIGRSLALVMPEHQVTVETSARGAFARFAAGERFDVILCDLLMPELNGWDVLARAQADWPDLVPRFVFMTGGAFTPESQRFLQRTKHRVLRKPFSIEELTAILTDNARQATSGWS